MRRRDFLGLFGVGAAGAWSRVARGQSAATPVIGYLGIASATANAYTLKAFHKGLGDAGFVEGRNVAIEYRFAEGDISRLPALAADLVNRQVNLLVAGANTSAVIAKAATSTIPIVFATGADPVQSGLVASLNHPGGNATGVSFFAAELEAKRLGLLHELVPKAELIAVLLNPRTAFFAAQTHDIGEAARALGLKIQIEHASNESEIQAAFAAFVREHAGALLVGADPYYNSRRALVIAPAAQYRLPAIYEWREFALAGGLMSYGTSLTDAYRQLGDYAGRILKGASTADLPVVQPTKFEFVINLKTARALGLEVPPGMLARVDEVIE